MANERIMWIVDEEYHYDPLRKSPEREGYVFNFLGEVNSREFHDPRPGYGIEEIRKVMTSYKGKIDLVTIDSLVEEELNVIKTLKGENIYEGKILLQCLTHSDQAIWYEMEKRDADFGIGLVKPSELVEVLKGIFGEWERPSILAFNQKRYGINYKTGLIVPINAISAEQKQ